MKINWLLIILVALGMQSHAQNAQMDAYVSRLMSKLTLDEKIGQLNLVTTGVPTTGAVVNKNVDVKIKSGKVGGIFGVYTPATLIQIQKIAVEQSRLHIPLLFGLDVIHGHKTIFPIPLALSSTWDLNLIEKSARIAATEATADGINWAFSPMVDIARDPRWGRISEGSGEDTYWGALVAKAMIRGYQGNDLSKNNTLLACVKHFALYGAAEAGREYNTVDMSPVKMYQYYLDPYKAAIESGAGSVMSSFNEVNGIPASGDKWLLTDILRKQWKFKGLVVSDYTSVNEMTAHGMGNLKTVSAMALNAGVDMDMVGEGFLTTIKQSLKEGKINQQQIDQACRRILEAKYKLGLFSDPYRYLNEQRAKTEILTEENRKAAREIAAHSFVLLKNARQTLPLKKAGTIALIGPLADNRRDMLGTWVIAGDSEKAITVLDGVKAAAGNSVKTLYAKGANITDDAYLAARLNVTGPGITDKRTPEDMLNEALEIAGKADVIVAVLGESSNMSGESCSRADIDIPESQKTLLKALVKTGKPVVLVLVNGRPLTLCYEDSNVDAILETFAGGTEAGNAIADVLFGKYNPAGKLTATFPRSVGQIPIYYNHKNTGRPDDGLENPQSKPNKSNYLDIPNDPLYPFGYGLSYTTFKYGNIKLSKNRLKGNEVLTASVTVTNTGKYEGEEVVQLYISDPVASVARSVKDLKKFSKISLKPAEQKVVSFTITPNDLKFYNKDLKYDWESGDFVIHIGTNSKNVNSATVNWTK